MKTIEQAVAFHHSLQSVAPSMLGYVTSITSMTGYASNQEDFSLTLKTYIAREAMNHDDPRLRAFMQGFHCVEISITAKMGGNHHDGSPRTETEIDIHVLDRLAGGMATKTWHTRGVWNAEVIADDEVIPLLKTLLAA